MTITVEPTQVVTDLDERFASRIAVIFPYNRDDVAAVKTVPGAKFVGKDQLKNGEEPYWTVPRDMMSARALRDAFGGRLVLTERLKAWGYEQTRKDSMLGSLSAATDAELENLPMVLPDVADALRGYQRAGVKFLSVNGGLIADQPGLGKTLQTIGALAEAEMFDDPEGGKGFLVIAPATSLEVTWLKELLKWQNFQAFVCVGGRKEREETINAFIEHTEFGGNGWLVVNPEMVRYRNVYDPERCLEHDWKTKSDVRRRCDFCINRELREYPIFNDMTFDAIVIDESHKVIRNPKTVTAKGVFNLRLNEGGRKIAMTGTPITNRPIDLWSVLHWLSPDTYSSKWRWAERFCEISDNGYGKVIGDLRDDTQEAFFESLKPYVLRRTKKEVAPELPDKNHIHVTLPFANKDHERQYRQFQLEAFVKIADLELGATGVLDELTRLRQFAIALCDISENPKGEGHPLIVQQTPVSAKVEWLDEHLIELGILDDEKGNFIPGSKEKIVVFSQFTRVIKMMKDHYEAKGCRVGEVSGRVSGEERRKQVAEFQDPNSGMSIILLNTNAGGVSIELDAADEVVFMDETWSHADMEQAEDRVHRANKGRTKQVNIYILRTEDTVETDNVMPKVISKKAISDFILDVRRGVMKS